MAEVNKEELRRLALDWIAAKDKVDATDDDDDFLEFNAVDEVWQETADGRAVLSLLDENAAQSARIAELERECERLRREFVEVEAERNAWRDGAKKIAVGRLDEIKEVQDLRDELEACRKDAELFRRLRDASVRDHGYTAEHFDAEFSRALDAIDAAMQEGGANG